jgi:glycosyltransferase involved in cell wall biosynthesis
MSPSDTKPTISVLMSTYNGERYVAEQIDSVLNQRDVNIKLCIRDDGSKDRTPAIIEEYARINPNLTISLESNVGVVSSFFALLKQVQPGSDYVAFADQDDYWLENKLCEAIKQLSAVPVDQPGMYYSRIQFTNDKLTPFGNSIVPTVRGFHNALVQNQATGCTIVLNKKAHELISSNLPAWALMHDWWCYLVVSAFGQVLYDEHARILYRKHGNNVTPATPHFSIELIARIQRYLGKGRIVEKVTDQVIEFKRIFNDKLTPEKRSIMNDFLTARERGFLHRLRYVLFYQRVRRNTPLDNVILKFLILTGKF